MKLFIASDIHGSKYYAEKLKERFIQEGADMMALLGDIYYHGPRNPLPKDYAPMEVAKILNGMKDKLIVVKGNCDSEVDQMISEFSFTESAKILVDNVVVTLTHGHKFNKDIMPEFPGDVLAYGHFHVNFMERVGNTLVANPGSVSLPKENAVHGYIIIENNFVSQFDIEGNLIEKQKIKE